MTKKEKRIQSLIQEMKEYCNKVCPMKDADFVYCMNECEAHKNFNKELKEIEGE